MTNENDLRIKEKLDFFLSEQIEVHVQLKDKTFLNGIIDRRLRDGVYWFIDKKLDGIYLFLKDIYEVEKFKEEKNDLE